MSRFLGFLWVVLLAVFSLVASTVAWESGLARDGMLMIPKPDEAGPQTTLAAQSLSAVDIIDVPMGVATVGEAFHLAIKEVSSVYISFLLAGIVIALLGWLFSIPAIRKGNPPRPYLFTVLMGGIPGILLIYLSMGESYAVVSALLIAMVAAVGIRIRPIWRMRALEFVGCTAVSAIWYFLSFPLACS